MVVQLDNNDGSKERKIAVITGSNSGIGFAIAQRLLDETSPSQPLTIVFTARHLSKVVSTIGRLNKYLATHEFLTYDYVLLDLGSLSSVYDAAKQLQERYKKIDYLFCNAGGGDFQGVDFLIATTQILSGLKNAVTYPRFKIERAGRLSEDGIGWVFQINVFAHYFLAQMLLDQLKGGSVVWVGSMEAKLGAFHPEDITLNTTPGLYETTKKYLQIMHYSLEPRWRALGVKTFLTHPGICATSMFSPHLNIFSAAGMMILFYIARLIGSVWHVIDSYKGSLAVVEVVLHEPSAEEHRLKHGSAVTKTGKPFVKTEIIEENEEHGEMLLAKLEELYNEHIERIKNGIN